MKRLLSICILLNLVWLATGDAFVFAAEVRAAEAPTPPMGWNSFDFDGVYLHQKAALANVDAMAEQLKPRGYQFFVVDNGWYGETKKETHGSREGKFEPGHCSIGFWSRGMESRWLRRRKILRWQVKSQYTPPITPDPNICHRILAGDFTPREVAGSARLAYECANSATYCGHDGETSCATALGLSKLAIRPVHPV